MPLSTDVKLPKDQTPVFPDKCVVCKTPNPDASYRIFTKTIRLNPLMWLLGRAFVVSVPACRSCRRLALFRRYGSVVAMLLTVGLAIAIFDPILSEHLHRVEKKYALFGIVIASLIPQIVLEAFFPQAVVLTATKENVDYEFSDKELAYEFAEINDGILEDYS